MSVVVDIAGIVGVHGHPRAARIVARGLRGLRRRGGHAAGIVAFRDGPRARREATDAFLDDEPALESLVGTVAVGQRHLRASADAAVGLLDAPRLPRVGRTAAGRVAVAASGALVSAAALREELLADGAALVDEGPEDILLQRVARSSQRRLVTRLADALWRLEGAFAVVAAAPGLLVAARDPHGLRPLVLGTVDGATVVASDEDALAAAGARLLREVAPGEMIVCDENGLSSLSPFPRREPAPCALEALLLASPVASSAGRSTWQLRRQLGAVLGAVCLTEADVVVAAPGAEAAAEGLAEALERPLAAALVPGAGTPRALPEAVAGRRVALVAPAASTAVRPVLAALLAAGASEVHLRLPTPLQRRECPYGLEAEVWSVADPDAVAGRLGATTAAWLTREQVHEALHSSEAPWKVCTGCLGGAWPIPPAEASEQLPLFEGGQEA